VGVAGVLLAAGNGSRLGQPKALVELAGSTLAERGVALLRDGGADPVIVVTGAVPVEIPGVVAVHNPEWETGMGSSLATGLRALGSGDASAAVIALADQPLVGAESVRRLIAAFGTGAAVAVAAYEGRPRNPVLIAREHWPAVLELATGDTGARPFLRAHPDLVAVVECGDTGSPDDVDTQEDLARVRSEATARSIEGLLSPTGRCETLLAATRSDPRRSRTRWVGRSSARRPARRGVARVQARRL
jgi:CTP:molybdopterin cytidylyltransferase MocA